MIANVGGDLNIESLQDTNTYKVDEKSLGIGISLCIPPFCYGMSSISGASANFGATNIDSNYASVTEQSGIKAKTAWSHPASPATTSRTRRITTPIPSAWAAACSHKPAPTKAKNNAKPSAT
ncbi:hemagglutinin repeat-containing protein [Pseudomonas poae]|uniref:hemagglutinin repeat-containing protein n=1 Tax=Pseudomonas poae TaxID=200451 RepID=UPI001E3ED90C|nr:hemagglutinin repeat-containing protein [Pseudomonas poae]